ncbi:MAG: hypothetical protein IPL78_29930 [Chloroflexi bacterium]|nr:hypothetical protein [Chloroflexota bacterium]
MTPFKLHLNGYEGSVKTHNTFTSGSNNVSTIKHSSEKETTSGHPGGANSKPAISIKYRTFAVNPSSGVYRATIKAENNLQNPVELYFWTIGDDQKVAAEVSSARFLSGADIPINNNGGIGPLSVSPDGLQVEIVLKTPRRVAMEVSAYEIV